MKLVVQRVKNASVSVDNKVTGKIDIGLLVYVGFDLDDNENDIVKMVRKLINLRVFSDTDGKMNFSVIDMSYDILVISQFTLLGNCKKGRRPSYDRALNPEDAKKMYNRFLEGLSGYNVNIESGVFQAHMDVKYINDGPVTLIIDSKE